MQKKLKLIALATLVLTACGADDGAVGPGYEPSEVSAKLNALFEEYFERDLDLNPLKATAIGDYRHNDRLANSIGPDYIAANRQLNETFLARLLDFDRLALPEQDQMSYDIFKLNLETKLEGDRYPGHLQPFTQFDSMTSDFVRLGSGTGRHPFRTVEHYEDFLGRIDDFVVYVDQAIDNMRQGMRAGVVQPRILMAKFLPQVQSQVVATAADSGFMAPIRNMPDSISAADRERLTGAYVSAIEQKLLPAFERLESFVRDEYLAAARETVGLYALPDGPAWYAYLAKRYTTTDLTPSEIHDIGLAEVERIHAQMRGVMRAIGFEGELKAFFEYVYSNPDFFFSEPEQLIQTYRDMTARVESRAVELFEVFPRTGFEVRRVELFRERSASKGSYQRGTPDGSRPGVFYANAYNVGIRPKWDMTSLFLHEAIPGHHFQISLTQENESLPAFRRFGSVTAYVEGWGLYSEYLGRELGLYEDPMDLFGSLNAELWRSIRLVVDTGIHAKGWTRQQVLDFMYANSAVSETRAVAEAERFMAYPGQALAYKIGQLKILEIRRRAESRLGDQFDVRKFHTEVLADGAMPLSMLQAKIDSWVEGQLR